MSEECLEAVIKGYMATPQPQHAFGWQGGEPTLMGVDFFRKVIFLQKKYALAGTSVANHVQTNAVLLDDDFADLFFKHNFLVGVSLDGPPELHNHFRTFPDGRGSYVDVLRGISALQKYNVKMNALCLVNAANVRRCGDVYQHLKDCGFTYHQYIPCVEFDSRGRLSSYAVRSGSWGKFLCSLFDQWVAHDVGYISIRYFDSLLLFLTTGKYNLCHMDKNCTQYFLVEHNGDIYPCDFFAESQLKLGNACFDPWIKIIHSEIYQKFGNSKSVWNSTCSDCPYLHLCSADCLKHRLSYGSKNSKQLSWLCEGYKLFFEYSLPILKEIAEDMGKIGHLFVDMVGPNDLCPCGSGKKFKKCCGKS